MRSQDPILKGLFSSETRVLILSHFFFHPGENFYLRQLEKLLNKPVGQIGPELKNLEKIYLLSSTKEGNQKRYSLNKEFVLYDELRSIFIKTLGTNFIIREAISRLPGLELAFIYGSWAEGKEHSGSDIDLMIIGNANGKKIDVEISRAEKELKRPINYSLYDRKEIKNRSKKKDNFILTVFSGPRIILFGKQNDELFRVN
jgi:predicted nucleotidyltransferase